MTAYHVVVLLFALAGFVALVVSMEKHGMELTGHELTAGQRKFVYWHCL